jgi:hypothetical protein
MKVVTVTSGSCATCGVHLEGDERKLRHGALVCERCHRKPEAQVLESLKANAAPSRWGGWWRIPNGRADAVCAGCFERLALGAPCAFNPDGSPVVCMSCANTGGIRCRDSKRWLARRRVADAL